VDEGRTIAYAPVCPEVEAATSRHHREAALSSSHHHRARVAHRRN
jgi:hypothetical protein